MRQRQAPAAVKWKRRKQILDFSDAIEKDYDAMVEDLQTVIRINSVEGAPEPGMPFGPGPARALEAFLDIGRRMGFSTENFDNYAGHIDFGQGEETVGVLCHVDVVPVGPGWRCDPFGGEIIDGKIYGRGTQDNKGPAMVCLHAMHILQQSGVPLKKKIRMILGANEETDWKCVDHYFGVAKVPQPDISFSPDAEFPVIYGEKGILQYTVSLPLSGPVELSGGNAFNAVPDQAQALLDKALLPQLKQAASQAGRQTGCTFRLEECAQGVRVHCQGLAAHAAQLERGHNAISGLMHLLSLVELTGDWKRISDFYRSRIGLTLHGEQLSLTVPQDESGVMTVNVGRVESLPDRVVFSLDSRVPVTVRLDSVMEQLRHAFGGEAAVEMASTLDPLYVPRDSFLIRTLMDTYRDVTGHRDAQPVSNGAATYARAVRNCVAFGALLPDQPDLMHQKDECLELDKLKLWLRIYLEALYRLAR